MVEPGWPQADEDVPLSFPDSVRLPGPARLHLRLDHWYRIVPGEAERGPYKCATVGYRYAIRDNEDRLEVIVFHWDQRGVTSPVTTPHLHLGAGARVGFPGLTELHLPSGRVAIEDVLHLAVELGAEPRPKHRDDWEKILRRTRAAYERWRTQ